MEGQKKRRPPVLLLMILVLFLTLAAWPWPYRASAATTPSCWSSRTASSTDWPVRWTAAFRAPWSNLSGSWTTSSGWRTLPMRRPIASPGSRRSSFNCSRTTLLSVRPLSPTSLSPGRAGAALRLWTYRLYVSRRGQPGRAGPCPPLRGGERHRHRQPHRRQGRGHGDPDARS